MATLTPELAGTALIITVVMYAITLGYSIYMAVLNYRQAKVKVLMEKNNELLEKILEELQLKNLNGKKDA